jgi:hypothetical protein
MSFQVATWYGAKSPACVPVIANEPPTSTTSGALPWPLSCLIAFSSSWLEPSGLASVILMPYLAVNAFMIAP